MNRSYKNSDSRLELLWHPSLDGGAHLRLQIIAVLRAPLQLQAERCGLSLRSCHPCLSRRDACLCRCSGAIADLQPCSVRHRRKRLCLMTYRRFTLEVIHRLTPNIIVEDHNLYCYMKDWTLHWQKKRLYRCCCSSYLLEL